MSLLLFANISQIMIDFRSLKIKTEIINRMRLVTVHIFSIMLCGIHTHDVHASGCVREGICVFDGIFLLNPVFKNFLNSDVRWPGCCGNRAEQAG